MQDKYCDSVRPVGGIHFRSQGSEGIRHMVFHGLEGDIELPGYFVMFKPLMAAEQENLFLLRGQLVNRITDKLLYFLAHDPVFPFKWGGPRLFFLQGSQNQGFFCPSLKTRISPVMRYPVEVGVELIHPRQLCPDFPDFQEHIMDNILRFLP